MHAVVHFSINSQTKFEVPSFTDSKDTIRIQTNYSPGNATLAMLSRVGCHPWLGLATINLTTTSEVTNSTIFTKI